MGHGGDISSIPNNQLACQDDVILPRQQYNMLMQEQHHLGFSFITVPILFLGFGRLHRHIILVRSFVASDSSW